MEEHRVDTHAASKHQAVSQSVASSGSHKRLEIVVVHVDLSSALSAARRKLVVFRPASCSHHVNVVKVLARLMMIIILKM